MRQIAPGSIFSSSPGVEGPSKLLGNRVFTQPRPTAVAHGQQLRGELKFIAATLVHLVIEKILTHLSLQARTPPRALARGQALQAA